MEQRKSNGLDSESVRSLQERVNRWGTYSVPAAAMAVVVGVVFWGSNVKQENSRLKAMIARADDARLMQRFERIEAARNLNRS